LLFEIPPPYTGSHSPVPLTEIPPALRWATIATEDANFYQNRGFDGFAILRAIWFNVRNKEILMGGSTITQQLVRNLMLAPGEQVERTLKRKMRELVLAVQITRRYTKDEILTFYLNEIYYGNMAYGVEAAAQAYYGKHVRDLDLAECAMLAGLPQLPARWNPLQNFEGAKKRQEVVLNLMVEEGYINAEEARIAAEEKLYFAATPFPIRAPHFVMYVRSLLEHELGLGEALRTQGLHITTTLDIDLNDTARDLMRHHLDLLTSCHYQQDCPPGGHNVRNAALLAMDPWTGEVLAMVGSPDYFATRIDGSVNGTLVLRQPGSSIKPITYAAAFERGELTPATMMLDVRTAFVTREGTPYVPLNYDLAFRGPVQLREALASSYNLIAVKVLDTIGIETMTRLARRLGITSFDNPDRLGLAVTLGGGEVRLLDLTAAYAAFANGGHRLYPKAGAPSVVRRVTDSDGNVLWEQPCLLSQQLDRDRKTACLDERVLDERVAYLITDILSDPTARVPTFGEISALNLTRPAAVKTGTTTDFRDNWAVGYTPEFVVGVWVGNADNEPMRHVTGVTGAAPIWHDVMEAALKGQPIHDFTRPEGLVETEVCAVSGQLPGPDCPHRVKEWFIIGTEPTDVCQIHQRIEDEVYTVLPPEAQEWAREHNVPQPPNTQNQTAYASPEPRLILTSPDAGAIYRIDPMVPRDAQKIPLVAETGIALKRVVFLANGEPLVHLDVPPYATFWQLEPGTYRFSALGIKADETNIMSNEVRIEVFDSGH
jgi:1A family penicillin-binding protein